MRDALYSFNTLSALSCRILTELILTKDIETLEAIHQTLSERDLKDPSAGVDKKQLYNNFAYLIGQELSDEFEYNSRGFYMNEWVRLAAFQQPPESQSKDSLPSNEDKLLIELKGIFNSTDDKEELKNKLTTSIKIIEHMSSIMF